jgi:tetratricopeptide (TPR) repeat protein
MAQARVFGRGLAVGLALLVAAPTLAAVSTIGGGLGRECYLAAEFNHERSMALEVCNKALANEAMKRRDRAATYVNRGIVHMQAREFDKALADYEAALRLDPRMAEAHVNRGIAILYRGGADREAVAALTRGLELRPSKPEVAYFTRAIAHEVLGDAQAAYSDYQAAASAAPGWDEPVEQLKRFSVQRKPTGNG